MRDVIPIPEGDDTALGVCVTRLSVSLGAELDGLDSASTLVSRCTGNPGLDDSMAGHIKTTYILTVTLWCD
jgi:hypothetical protein